jgi:hypothetical protein
VIVALLLGASALLAQDTGATPASADLAPSRALVEPATAAPGKEGAGQEGAGQEGAGQPPLELVSMEDVQQSLQRSVGWLLERQNADGSWGHAAPDSLHELGYSPASFRHWQLAGGAIVLWAFLQLDETPQLRGAIERGLDFTLKAPLPMRGSDWDIDGNWALLYVTVLLDHAAGDPRFQAEPWKSRYAERIRAKAEEYLARLEIMQSPLGGWGYYEGEVVAARPSWATSFSTAAVVPALHSAKARGWKVDEAMCKDALAYVRRCALPSGAYQYDLRPVPRIDGGEGIDEIKGSLGRIQIGNWARRVAGDRVVDDEKIARGLDLFFEHHRFLDVARMRPVPHEAYYANAGYFYFFGHCYAALAADQLADGEARRKYHRMIRGHVLKAQATTGQYVDFVGSFYSWTYATGFALVALQRGLLAEGDAR